MIDIKNIFAFLVFFLSLNCFAGGESAINSIGAWGNQNTSHNNVMQIALANGFLKSEFNNGNGACDKDLAAIRTASPAGAKLGQELVSMAMAAYLSKQPIGVWLDPTDKYFGNRCVIVGIWMLSP
ncbi:MAG TPA: hypothetical protein VIZ65_05435 [Cellvibrionaceae bacterium]